MREIFFRFELMKKIIPALAFCILTAIPFYIQAQTSDASIFSVAEQMPEYPGGSDSLMNDVIANVIYPKQCLDSNIQGKVYLRFVVNEDGTLSNIEAVKSPNKLLSESAIAAIDKIKKFKPGKQNGKPVKVWSSVPVSFKIKKKPIEANLPETYIGITDSSMIGELKKNVNGDTSKFRFVEELPEFPGGDGNLISFLSRNLSYPQNERDNGIQGKVILKFLVTETGNIESITVLKSASPGLDREAVRVMSLSPKWRPGFDKGKPIRVQYLFPIVFKLTGGDWGLSEIPKTIFDYMPDGRDGMERFFYENMVYPSSAISSKTEAVMRVKCELGEDLKLHPIIVKNDLDSIFGQEACRLINAFPPLAYEAKSNASFFKESYYIRIKFTLDRKHQTSSSIDYSQALRFIEEGTDFFKVGKFDKALEYFNAAIKYYSLNSDAFYNRAVIELKTNKIADACDDFRRAYLLGDLDAMNGIKQTCK